MSSIPARRITAQSWVLCPTAATASLSAKLVSPDERLSLKLSAQLEGWSLELSATKASAENGNKLHSGVNLFGNFVSFPASCDQKISGYNASLTKAASLQAIIARYGN